MTDHEKAPVSPGSHLLLVEDEEDLAEPLAFALGLDGHTVEILPTGAATLERLSVGPRPDVVLLDLMLPDMTGLEICRRIRGDAELADLPILMVTARAEEYDRIAGFEVGADDYVTKPYSLREMRFRVASLLRRATVPAEPAPPVAAPTPLVTVDAAAHTVQVAGEPIELSVVEFRLLSVFLESPDVALGRDRLREATWGDDYAITLRAVDTNVKRLRERLGPAAACLQTVRGVGYRWSTAGEGGR